MKYSLSIKLKLALSIVYGKNTKNSHAVLSAYMKK